MRPLLRAMPEGVPDECLLARIRGRRSFFLGDWSLLLISGTSPTALPPAPWRADPAAAEEGWIRRALQREYRWVYRHMEECLRGVFAPLFWLEEVRTLAICLRHRTGGRETDSRLLAGSLLADDLRRSLRTAPTAAALVAALAKTLQGHDPAFARLEDVFRDQGTRGLEAALADLSLHHMAAAPQHPVIARFLALLIDARNLTGLAKHLHWQMPDLPPLLPGGAIPLPRLRELFVRGDAAAIGRLASHMGSRVATPPADSVEKTVDLSLLRTVRRMAREPEGVGMILDYLWRCGLEARNLGLLARIVVAGAAAVEEDILP